MLELITPQGKIRSGDVKPGELIYRELAPSNTWVLVKTQNSSGTSVIAEYAMVAGTPESVAVMPKDAPNVIQTIKDDDEVQVIDLDVLRFRLK